MNSLIIAASLLFVCDTGSDPQYQGKTVAQWTGQTGVEFSVPQRCAAINALSVFARERMGWPNRPEDSPETAWVAREIVPTLSALLTDEHPEIRRDAANAFCNLRTAGRQAIPDLTKLLTDRDKLVRQRAAQALGAMGEAARGSIPSLVKMVRDDPAPFARKNAAEALVHIGAPHEVARLLNDESAETRLATVSALRFSPQYAGQARTELQKLSSDSDPRIRVAALGALSMLRPAGGEALAIMTARLHDDNVQVRRQAAAGLVQLGQLSQDLQPALPELLKGLSDDDERVRNYLAGALGGLGKSIGKTLKDLPGDDQRGIASGRLFMIVAALEKLLSDKQVHLRAAACEALGEIGPEAKHAVPALKPLLTDMEMLRADGRVCNRAGWALVKITGDKHYLDGLPVVRDGL